MKRKNVTIEVKAEPEKKILKKSDLLLEYHALQQKFDAQEEKYNILDEDNATHMDAIEMLEETVKLLELKLPNVEQKSASVQTEIITDDNCKLATENASNFEGHMHAPHTSTD